MSGVSDIETENLLIRRPSTHLDSILTRYVIYKVNIAPVLDFSDGFEKMKSFSHSGDIKGK